MAHKLSQQQRILQKMVLTPQMRQSIKLLSMSTKDLNEYIESVVESNLFLKKTFDNKRTSSAFEYNDQINQEVENDVRSSLVSQLRMLDLKDKALEIAEYLIYEMNDNGYIAVSSEEAAEDLFTTVDEVERCLAVIQSLDPAGIGARDVRECLQLQLKRMNKKDSLEYTIVTDFINELARNDIENISKALNVDKEKVRGAVNNIKKLNPHPTGSMLGKGAERVIPDFIAAVKDEKIRLALNREWLPRLNLYNPYENEANLAKDLEAKKFMKENMEAARNLIDNVRRREETMWKVADYILNFQREALISDINDIKSLTIMDISKALNLHPTTINRTVSNKYIQIEDNVVPLKSFISHGIKKENGELASKTAIKKKIETLVKNEDKAHPLSDNTIHKKLAEEGIIIKRRTIAKYRKSLRILPTYLRKKF